MKSLKTYFIGVGIFFVVATVVFWTISGLTHPGLLTFGVIAGVAVILLSKTAPKLSKAYDRRIYAREEAKREVARVEAEQAAARELAEKEAVFDKIVLPVATPDKIEAALRYLAGKRSDLSEPLAELLEQFDRAKENVDRIHDFEQSNSNFTNDVPAFESALIDIATNSKAVINAVKLGANIEEYFADTIAKNRKILIASEEVLSAIQQLMAKRYASRQANPSLSQLDAIRRVYAVESEEEGGPK